MHQTHFMTYGNEKFKNSKERLLKEAMDSGWFATSKTYGPENLDQEFVAKFANVLKMPRIAGYGIWRPYIIEKELQNIRDGDFLVYLDAGCSINSKGFLRFNEYIEMLQKSNYGIISFQMPHAEKCWTTKQVFDHFSVSLDSKIANSGQYLDGILIMKKCAHLDFVISEWIKSVHDNVDMFTDKYNRQQNDFFKGHRHEQSVLSVLCKIHGSCVVDTDETYFVPFGGEDSMKYPFWATRIKC